MTSIDFYRSNKKQSWIKRQLAQGMIVYFRENDRLFIIKSVETENGQLIAINKTNKRKLESQILYASKSDITNPVGKYQDKALDIPEYVDLICSCF